MIYKFSPEENFNNHLEWLKGNIELLSEHAEKIGKIHRSKNPIFYAFEIKDKILGCLNQLEEAPELLSTIFQEAMKENEE